MEKIVADPGKARAFGRNGNRHVRARFSRDFFAQELDASLLQARKGSETLAALRKGKRCGHMKLWALCCVLPLVALLLVGVFAAHLLGVDVGLPWVFVSGVGRGLEWLKGMVPAAGSA